ncbi:patatin-like phospholipase domain-containing protein 2 isoform X2 [Acipenser ruthenus]|uniref:patatin-like phospholipase domain-containing protein 2 isoform X2 n=1 Tax=Acipenser ruthenus TaxID=7906 RepID=UPI00274170FF|nr:patatin-like phospholipase domain-containing protein 2 isoform X2 [Acipenser ruthenus]
MSAEAGGVQSGGPPFSISFSGSGFMVVYQFGATQCLLDLAPEVIRAAPKVYGASAGSLAAAAVVCGANMERLRDEIVAAALQLRRHFLGPLHPSFSLFKVLKSCLLRSLPENAHELATGRLHVSMTRLADGKNILVSDFQSREDLVQALLCSCFVPVYCGLVPPSFRGQALKQMYYRGYQDAIVFLQRHDLMAPQSPAESRSLSVASLRCSDGTALPAMQSSLQREGGDSNTTPTCADDSSDESEELDWTLSSMEQTLYHSLPAWVQGALLCNIVGKLGLLGFLSSFLPARLASYILLPYTLPVFLTYSLSQRVLRWLVALPEEMFWFWQEMKHFTHFMRNVFIQSVQQQLLQSLVSRLSLSPVLSLLSPPFEEDSAGIPTLRRRSTLCLHLSGSSSLDLQALDLHGASSDALAFSFKLDLQLEVEQKPGRPALNRGSSLPWGGALPLGFRARSLPEITFLDVEEVEDSTEETLPQQRCISQTRKKSSIQWSPEPVTSEDNCEEDTRETLPEQLCISQTCKRSSIHWSLDPVTSEDNCEEDTRETLPEQLCISQTRKRSSIHWSPEPVTSEDNCEEDTRETLPQQLCISQTRKRSSIHWSPEPVTSEDNCEEDTRETLPELLCVSQTRKRSSIHWSPDPVTSEDNCEGDTQI